MPSFNKVVLVGNLTRDPELRYTPKGMAIVNISLAINRHWTNEAGEKKEEVTFVECDGFGRTAETIAQYMKKGLPLLVEGRLRLQQWDDKQTGHKRQKLSVVVEGFQFLGGKRDDGGQSDNDGGTGGRTWDRTKTAGENARAASGDAPPPTDDDVPF